MEAEDVIDFEQEEAPPVVDEGDANLSGDFDSLDDAARAAAPEPTEPISQPLAGAGDAGTQPPASPDPGILPGDPPLPASGTDKPPEAPPLPAAGNVAHPSQPVPGAGTYEPIPAMDLKGMDYQKYLADLTHDLADVDLLDDSAEGGKVKLGAIIADTPGFMQAAAVIASAAVDRALAPYRQMMPALQETAAEGQRERFLGSLTKDLPEARTLADDPEYWNWVDQQPKEFQMAAESPNPAAVLRVMKLYQQETGAAAPAAPVVDPAKQAAAQAALEASRNLHKGTETARAGQAPVAANVNDPAKLKEDFENITDD